MRRTVIPLLALLLVPLAAAGTPDISVEAGNSQVCPTGSGEYRLKLSNPGPAADTYTVDVAAPWPDAATLSDSSVEVDGGESTTIPFWIRAPKTASRGDHGFSVSATSSNTGKTVRAEGTVTVLSCRSVDLEPVQDSRTVCRGDDATYTIRVTNDGEVEETYRLSRSAGSLSRNKVTLAPGASTEVTLTASSRTAAEERITVNAESTSSYAADSTSVSFTAEQCRDVDLSVTPVKTTACRSDSVPVTATVTNTGNISDRYQLRIDGERLNLSLAAGQTLTVKENVPATQISGQVPVSVQSLNLSSVSDSGVSRVTTETCYDISLAIENTAPDTANQTLVELALANNGTRQNTYRFQLDGPDWMDVQPENVTLGPGEQSPVYVYMAPDFFADGTYTPVLVAEGQGIRKTINMNVTARNGTVTVETQETRTPTGRITRASPGAIAVVITAFLLLIGGYYLFYRNGEGAEATGTEG